MKTYGKTSGKGPAIKLQILLWPVADACFNSDSYIMYAEQRFLTSSMMKWMFDQYTTDPGQRKEIYVSPLHATPEELKGLPPTIIKIAENDILRDEGEALGRNLDKQAWKWQQSGITAWFMISVC